MASGKGFVPVAPPSGKGFVAVAPPQGKNYSPLPKTTTFEPGLTPQPQQPRQGHVSEGFLGNALVGIGKLAGGVGTGIYDQGHALESSLGQTVEHPWIPTSKGEQMWSHPLRFVPGTANTHAAVDTAAQVVNSYKQLVTNPTNWKNDLLTGSTLLPGAFSTFARAKYLAEVARVVNATKAEKAAVMAKTLNPHFVPPSAPRNLKVPTTVFNGDKKVFVGDSKGVITHERPTVVKYQDVPMHASQRPMGRAMQAGHDAVINKAMDLKAKTGLQNPVAGYGEMRAKMANDEMLRRRAAIRNATAADIHRQGERNFVQHVLGRSGFDKGISQKEALAAVFLKASQLTGDEYHAALTGKNDREAAVGARLEAKGVLRLTHDNKVEINSEQFPKLAAAEAKMKVGQLERDKILTDTGQMDAQGIQNRANLVQAVIGGAHWDPARVEQLSQLTDRDSFLLHREAKNLGKTAASDVIPTSKTFPATVAGRLARKGYLVSVKDGWQITDKGAEELGKRYAQPGIDVRLRGNKGGGELVKVESHAGVPHGVVRYNRGRYGNHPLSELEHENAGFVGGHTSRPGEYFQSLDVRSNRGNQSFFAKTRGKVVPRTQKIDLGRAATGEGIREGVRPANPFKAAANSLVQAHKFLNTEEGRALAAKYGSDVYRGGDAVLVRDTSEPGSNTLSGKILDIVGRRGTGDLAHLANEDHGLKQTLAKVFSGRDVSMREMGAEGRGMLIGLRALIDEDFVGLQGVRPELGMEAPPGWKWVPKQMVPNEVQDTMRGYSPSVLMEGADDINAATTALTVYLRLGHLPTRVSTNAFTNLVQGSLSPKSLADTVRVYRQLSKDSPLTLHQLAAATGAHGYEALPREGTKAIRDFASWGAKQWARYVDAPFRINSMMFELRKEGFTTAAEMKRAAEGMRDGTGLTPEEAERVHRAAGEAERASITYGGMSNLEKTYIARFIWFYPWFKGSARFVGRTAINNPVKAQVMLQMANEGSNRRDKALGGLMPEYAYGYNPLGGGRSNDFSTFTSMDTAGQIAGLIHHPFNASSGIEAFANPATSAMLASAKALAEGKNPFTAGLTQAFAASPEAQVLQAWRGDPTVRRFDQNLSVLEQQGNMSKQAASRLRAIVLGSIAAQRIHGIQSPWGAFMKAVVGPGLPQDTHSYALNMKGLEQVLNKKNLSFKDLGLALHKGWITMAQADAIAKIISMHSVPSEVSSAANDIRFGRTYQGG